MKSRELILDSNVVMADVFQESTTLHSIDVMKSQARRSGVGLLITETVRKECADSLDEEMKAESQSLRDLKDFILSKKRGEERDDYKVMVREKDLGIVQEFFRLRMYAVRRSIGKRERLRRLMEYVVEIFNATQDERGVLDLFLQANMGIVRLHTEFSTTLDAYKRNIVPYSAREGQVRLMKRKLRISNTNDVKILLESAEYRDRKNPKTVFTTLDSGDIMNAAPFIETYLRLRVRDPLVAVSEVIQL